MPTNEGKACDAVLRVMERKSGNFRSDVRFPERDKIGPPIELECHLGDRKLAVEHTVVEAFEGQIGSAVQFSRLLGSIEQDLSGQLPSPGVYYLNFPISPHVGIRTSDHTAIRAAIAHWVVEKANDLHASHPDRLDRSTEPRGHRGVVRGQPASVPFELTLVREVHWGGSIRHDGRLFVARTAPEDLESGRNRRILAALNKKCPKLLACRSHGCETVLIFESDDVALTNHIVIAEALETSSQGRNDLPDEVYFVSTQVEPWTVWTLKCGSTFLPDDGFLDFAPEELSDLTGR